MNRTLLLLCALLLSACGKPAGSPCAFTGSGFHARHDCATQCLARWTVNCPGGETLQPQVCAGRSGCQPGDCADGEVCYHFDDPFEERSYCVPDDLCGALSDDALQAWERDSRQAAADLRAHYEAKRARRTGQATAPDAQPLPAPWPAP